MNENTFLIFTGIHPSLSLFQENIETEVMDSWWRVVKRLFSFLLLVQHFTITLLNDQDYSPDGRLIVNVISEETRRSLPWRAINRWPAWSCRQGRDPAIVSFFFFYKWSPTLKKRKEWAIVKEKRNETSLDQRKRDHIVGPNNNQLRLMAHNSRFL